MLLDGQLNRERNPSLWLGKSRKDRTRTAVIEKSRLNSYSIAPHLCDALNESSRERRDAKRRRPGDVDYDPRTLYLPAEFAKSLTGGQGGAFIH
ncbi:hypothetical protein NC652_007463 [Populus alba x Populus x berolinensis]|nr:hypothetical protein NC652_007463 [Populus alba x Populus x berolinensis]